MFKMCGARSVAGCPGPAIGHNLYMRTSFRRHWFNGNNQIFKKLIALSPLAPVGNLRIFVHGTAYAMPHQLAHDTESLFFEKILYRVSNITNTRTGLHLQNTSFKRLPGSVDDRHRTAPDYYGSSGV